MSEDNGFGRIEGDASRGLDQADREPVGDRVKRLEAALLHIAEADWHYRTPPKPKTDGGMRGPAGLVAVRALIDRHGSYTSDEELRKALTARSQEGA